MKPARLERAKKESETARMGRMCFVVQRFALLHNLCSAIAQLTGAIGCRKMGIGRQVSQMRNAVKKWKQTREALTRWSATGAGSSLYPGRAEVFLTPSSLDLGDMIFLVSSGRRGSVQGTAGSTATVRRDRKTDWGRLGCCLLREGQGAGGWGWHKLR